MTSEPHTPASALQLSALDNVAVARQALVVGQTLALGAVPAVLVREPIPSGHKVALQPIAIGQPVYKYGQRIGLASADIAPGQHVHVHNLAMAGSDGAQQPGQGYVPTVPAEEALGFDGYLRPDGRVGTRNYLGVIASVNCSATVCRHIADAFKGEALAAYPHVDGVVAITHGSGCGMGGDGEGLVLLQRTLRGYANHPNFAGVLVIGLGCRSTRSHPWSARWRLARPACWPASPSRTKAAPARPLPPAKPCCTPCCGRPTRPAANGCRCRTSRSACSAAARTATRASAPTRCWVLRSICWCATEGAPSCPKRPRSMAPSTCSPTAPPAPRWPSA